MKLPAPCCVHSTVPRFSRFLATLSSVVAVGSLLYAWQLNSRLNDSDAARLAVEKESAALQARVAQLEKDAEAFLAGRAGSPRPGLAAADGESGGNSGPTPARSAESRRGGPGGRAAFFDSPEMQKLAAVERRAMLDGRFAALFRKLNLSPDSLEKFKALLADRQAAATDVMSAAQANGMNPRENRDQIRALITNAETEIDNNIRATLGDSVYQQYMDYERTMPQRGLTTQLEQRLSYTSTPLNPNQTEQLVTLLAAANPNANASPQTGFFGGGFMPGRGSTTITDAVVTQSQTILNSQQVDALRQLQQEQQAREQIRQQIRNQNRAGAGGTTSSRPAGS